MPAPEASRPERIGLFGGTFDPPHAGHVAAALSCRDFLDLDRLLLVVANSPWQKEGQREISDAETRWELVSAAADGLDGIEPSRIEIDRGGPSFTIETVEELERNAVRSGLAPPEFFLLVGSDLVASLPTWQRVDTLRRRVTLVVVGRPGAEGAWGEAGPPAWRVEWVEGERVDVSSSQVREAVAAGRPLGDEVPSAVVRLIGMRGLYAGGR